jgi:proteasome lid subunit RPN8/RPN11
VSIWKPINDRIVQDSHATDNEIIGLLLGRLEKDTIIIEDAVSGEFSGEPTRVQLLPSTLAKIADDILSGRIKGNIIGWYHSHPTGGLFFSETDVETQKIFQQFSRLTIGMVVDTQTGHVGYFRVDREGKPYRVPDENVRTYKDAAEAVQVGRPTQRQPILAPVNKLIAQKIVLSGILIALIVAIALVGVITYRTSMTNQTAVPTINHTPILTANVSQPITVTANTTGTFQSITLFYETVSSTSFTSVVMTSPATGEYQYSIPGKQVDGDITYYITGSSASGAKVSTPVYHIQVADFLPEVLNATLTIYRNSTKPVISQITLQPINGFHEQLTISAQAPPGISVTLPSNVQAGTSVQISMTASANALNGTFPVVISATYAPTGAQSITHETRIYVTVTDFALRLTPRSDTVFVGTQATYNLTLTVASGFSAPIQVKELNLPAGAKAQVLSSGTVLYGPGSGVNTLQIMTAGTTRPGTYTITVVATATLDTGDYIVHSQTIQLTVR